MWVLWRIIIIIVERVNHGRQCRKGVQRPGRSFPADHHRHESTRNCYIRIYPDSIVLSSLFDHSEMLIVEWSSAMGGSYLKSNKTSLLPKVLKLSVFLTIISMQFVYAMIR